MAEVTVTPETFTMVDYDGSRIAERRKETVGVIARERSGWIQPDCGRA